MRELIRAVFKTGVGSGTSMILSAVSSKTIAVVSGPFGIGLYSLIQQLTQTVSASGLAGGARTAMAQGIPSRDNRNRDEFILTAFWILAIGAVIASLSLVLLAPWIALFVFNMNDGATIGLVRWISIPVVLTIALAYLTGVLNGFMAIGRLAVVQVAGAAVNAILAYPISIMVDTGYPVAFVAMVTISLAVQVLAAYSKVHRGGYTRSVIANGFRPRIESQAARSFFAVAGTMMVGSIVASISLLFIRALVAQHGGIEEAGIFNVAWIICVVYPTVILTSFATYYLPRLSQAADLDERNDLMNKVLRLTTILIVPLELLAIVLKPLMIDVLYSDEFHPSLIMLRWMILGVFLKATAQVFAMPMLSSVDMKTYFWTGNLQYVGFVLFAILSVMYFGGLEIIGVGYVVVHGAYFVYSLRYAISRHGYVIQPKYMTAWFAGLALIIVSSLMTWHDSSVNLAMTLFFMVCGLLYVALSVTKHERGKAGELILRTLSPGR